MQLQGIEFGNILGASGVQGFFGEGYWFHKPFRPFGLDFKGMTFVSKTTTLIGRKGNMPLNRNYGPRWPFPSCIKMRPFRGIMLNSVGLSGPGLGALLGTYHWHWLADPFFISIMSLADTLEKRKEEFRIMVDILRFCKEEFQTLFGLQINLSCLNTGHDPAKLIGESAKVLDIASALDVPLMPKYSIASTPIEAVMELEKHPHCDAICVSNTLPYDWRGIGEMHCWGRKKSPLARYGGGGISGEILRPFVCNWIYALRQAGFTKPINGGGGILSPADVIDYYRVGASSVFLGSGATMRPWRVKSIIAKANDLNWRLA